jgi:hypothetical protein
MLTLHKQFQDGDKGNLNETIIGTVLHILSHMNSVNTFESYFPKINSNIIFPSVPRFSEWSLSFRF